MTPIQLYLLGKNNGFRPVWIMRQAGRYLPEFRKIRKKNKNFIKLCLNKNLVPKITLQPLERFKLDAAIIFSDILMLPYALGQDVQFEKNLGPILGDLNIKEIKNITNKDFSMKLKPVYDSVKIVSKSRLLVNKDLIGFAGSPWTILLYMMNKSSPKNKLSSKFLEDKILIKETLDLLCNFTKLHIHNQIKNGATIIQLFDSWAGLVKNNYLEEYVFKQNKKIVDFVKRLNVPVICFPKGIKNYYDFVKYVKPNVISIDYNTNPKKILKKINIPIQGGINPKLLLGSKKKLKKEVEKYIEIFKNYPYIFNLGHGILPETKPLMVEYFINLIKQK
tara:strand:- start:252 stop:1253 length:1002 start_codon:yes stop_codon:yes gene_type:complete